MCDWINGFAGNTQSQEDQANLVHVIIAGNSIKGHADQHKSKGLRSGKIEDDAAAKDMADGKERLDQFLEAIGQNCQVTLMPGQYDVTTYMMPQRSMHPISFPLAKRFDLLQNLIENYKKVLLHFSNSFHCNVF